MLKNLYKHEFKALFRNLLPMYLILLGLSILDRIVLMFNANSSLLVGALQSIITIIYGVAIFAMAIITVVIIATRFYKNLFTSEGYLTFTLPVKSGSHLTCKLICSTLIIYLTGLVAMVSVFLLSIGTDAFNSFYNELIEAIFSQQFLNLLPSILGTGVSLALSVPCFLLMLYASMSIGQTFKNKISGSILTFALIYVAMQIIGVLTILIPLPQAIATSSTIEANIVIATNYWFILIPLVLEAIYGIALYCISRHMITKKLNVG